MALDLFDSLLLFACGGTRESAEIFTAKVTLPFTLQIGVK